MNGRHVPTPYGPMPGCPDCGVIVLSGGPFLCEHGVVVADGVVTAEGTIVVDLPDVRRAWKGAPRGDEDQAA